MDQYNIKMILSDNRYREAVEFWTKKARSSMIYGTFPKERSLLKETELQTLERNLSQNLAEALLNRCGGSDQGVLIFGLAGLHYLLWKYTGAVEAITGLNHLGRIIPFGCALAGDMTFKEWLEAVKTAYAATCKHSILPAVARNYLLNPEAPQAVEENIKIYGGLRERPKGTCKPELSFVFNAQKGITVTVEYSLEDCQEQMVDTLMTYLEAFYRQGMENPQIHLEEIQLAGEMPPAKVLGKYESTHTLHGMFSQQAQKRSSSIALKFGEQTLTYEQLESQSLALAGRLIQLGVQPGDRVGLMLGKSIEMIVGILAILKTGSAYVPIEPNYPESRKYFMLKDAGVKILLTAGAEQSGVYSGAVYNIKDLLKEKEMPVQPIEGGNAESLAYIIYTSGTTGTPKGVMITHQNVLSLLKPQNNNFDFDPQDKWLLFHSFGFDVSVWEIFGSLLYGGCLLIAPDTVLKNGEALAQFVDTAGITVFNQTPSAFFRLLGKVERPPSAYGSLRYVIFAGEALYPGDIEPWHRRHPHVKLLNLYGITEITVHGTYKEITDTEIAHNCSNIGVPFSTLDFCLLDEHQRPVADGLIGEIYVRGHGVAKGYLNRPELTAERFLELPRLGPGVYYKSGDLARKRTNGEYEYMGRNDHQVKINGYRIELKEIQRYMSGCPGVTAAVVVQNRLEAHKVLYGFYTAQGLVSGEAMYQHLKGMLPQFMIPAHLTQVRELPLTANGKVDAQALLALETEELQKLVLPRTPEEKAMASVWQDVLQRETIGIHDNFFALGGDSISGFLIVSRLKSHLMALELSDLFEYPTIAQLAPRVTALEQPETEESVEGEVPLSPIQNWFFSTSAIQPFVERQQVLLKCAEPLNIRAVEQTVRQLLRHHDALRITVRKEGECYTLYNKVDIPVDTVLQVKTFDGETPLETALLALQQEQTFEWDGHPLVQMTVIKGFEADYLYIQAHHMVTDSVSWRILLDDFRQCYGSLLSGGEGSLLSKTTAYKTWTCKFKEPETVERFYRQREYWDALDEKIADGYVFVPGDLGELGSRRLEDRVFQGKTLKTLEKANCRYQTQTQDLLLAALALALKNFKQTPWVIDLESHGRLALTPEVKLDRTVGWFTALYPFELPQAEDIKTLICNTKEALRTVPDLGVGYGVLRYNEAQLFQGKPRRHPEVLLNYLGQWEDTASVDFESLKVPGEWIQPLQSSPYAVIIDCGIEEDSLKIDMIFDQARVTAPQQKQMLEAFKKGLAVVTDHCLQGDEIISTPSDYGTTQITQEELECILTRMESAPESIYSLSPMQKGILYHHQWQPQAGTYTIQQMYSLQGDLNIDALKKSLTMLADRYEILRTRVMYKGLSTPVQCVEKTAVPQIEFQDLRTIAPENREAALRTLLGQDLESGFELDKAPFRITLVQTKDNVWELLWSFHHIVIDGWGMVVLFESLLDIYRKISKGQPVSLNEIPPYKDYIDWVNSQDQKQGMAFWENYLKVVENGTLLYGDQGRKLEGTGSTAEYRWTLEGEALKQWQTLCQQKRVTLNQGLQTLWGLMLQQFSGSEDVVFGSVLANRPDAIPGVEQMVGLFINTVPVRVKAENDCKVMTAVQRAQSHFFKAQQHAYCHLGDVLNLTPAKGQLIHHLFIYENYPKSEGVEKKLSGLNLTGSYSYEQTHYDLDLSVYPGEALVFEFKYNPSRYSAQYIETLKQTLMDMVSRVIKNPEITIEELKKQGIVKNQEAKPRCVPPVCRLTAHQCFEKYALQNPEQIAVIAGDEALTYSALNHRAEVIANALRQKDVGREDIVGLWMGRTLNTLAALLGIWKAGAAYLPIDSTYPKDWVNQTLTEAGASMVVTDCPERKQGIPTPVLSLTELDFNQQTKLCPNINHPQDLAYVIATSGTTGKPKLVMVEHRNLLAMVDAWKTDYRLEQDGLRTVLQLASISFDVFTGDLGRSLLAGGTLVMATETERMDFKQIYRLLRTHKVNLLETTPSVGIPLMDMVYDNQWALPSLKLLILGSDTLNTEDFAHLWRRYGGQFRMVNSYGTTETTIDSSFYEPGEEGPGQWTSVPIGKPMTHVEMYVLDKNREPVAPGVEGELYIGGLAVARGYMDEAMSREKFVQNPFRLSERIYRTGDYARILADGNIQFLGRQDDQIKIRGMRVETKEIEGCFKSWPGIDEVVVAGYGNAGAVTGLAAFYTAAAPVDGEVLKAYGAKRLKPWMVPDRYWQLEQMPLTSNRKIDKKALLMLLEQREQPVESFKRPQNIWEEQLLAVWQQVFQREIIGVDQDFFELGGHSILLMKLMAQIYQTFEVEIKIGEIFGLGTIEKMAAYIRNREQRQRICYPAIGPESLEAVTAFPLTEIQRAYMLGRNQVFQMSNVATYGYEALEGPFDLPLLEEALNRVIQRHEMMRAVFLPDGTQRILEDIPRYTITVEDLTQMPVEDREQRLAQERQRMANQVLNPEQWPLFEIKGFKLGEKKWRIGIGVDALFADDLSFQRIVAEILGFYTNPQMDLKPLTYSFKAYVLALEAIKQTEYYARDRHYWAERLSSIPQAPELPYRKAVEVVEIPHFARRQSLIPKAQWEQLKEQGLKRRILPTTLLAAAYAEVLSWWSNQNDLTLNLTLFNRLPLHPEVNDIVGDFTSIMLLDFQEVWEQDFWQLAQRTQERLNQNMQHRHYDGVSVLRDLARYRQQTGKVLMPVVLTSVLGQPEIQQSLEGMHPFKRFESINQTSQVTLDNQVSESLEGLNITWDYVEELFDPVVIEAMHNTFIQRLVQVSEGQEQMDELVDSETVKVYSNYNNTTCVLEEGLLHQGFEEAVLKFGDQTACCFKEETLTYKALDQKARQVAQYLQGQGIGPGDFVGIRAARQLGTIVNILGVLKAGAAYVPIDPVYPQYRQQYMMEQSRCEVVLEPKLYEQEALSALPETFQNVGTTLDDIAYVIYTSGSTGKPKGVVITHRAAVNTLADMARRFPIGPEDKVMGVSSFAFDLSVYDLFAIFKAGGCYVMAEDPRDMEQLMDTMEQRQISVWNSVPAIMEALIKKNPERKGLETLRWVFLSGDWIPVTLSQQIYQRAPKCRVVSLGGATEAAIWSICYPISPGECFDKSVPYGRPLSNQGWYVLDGAGRLSPSGAAGELHISGKGLAKEYHNDLERTEAAFIKHPVWGDLYKTGDYGILHHNGIIEFLGRKDTQVKIKGFRIEMGEVETHMLQFPGVQNAVVAVKERETGEKYLCSFYTGKGVTGQDLRIHLLQRVPEYMVPQAFVALDQIPLTDNGKVDRKRLSCWEAEASEQTPLQPPETEEQKIVADIWRTVLVREDFGIQSDFFELGGDSLKGIEVIQQINKALGTALTVTDIYLKTTVKALAEGIQAVRKPLGHVIQLRKAERNPKILFAFHAGSGEVGVYGRIARRLTGDYDVWGISGENLKEYDPCPLDLKELVVQYVEDIRTLQPQGPYRLMGWCVGGVMAFEAARQLEALGQNVEEVVMLNSRTPSEGVKAAEALSPETEKRLIERYMTQAGRSVDQIPDWHQTKTPWQDLMAFAQTTGQSTALAECLKEAIPAEIAQAIPEFETEENLERLVRYFNRIRSLNYGNAVYRPEGLLKAPVYYIEALEDSMDAERKWQQFAETMVYHSVKADHHSLIVPEGIEAIIALLEW